MLREGGIESTIHADGRVGVAAKPDTRYQFAARGFNIPAMCYGDMTVLGLYTIGGGDEPDGLGILLNRYTTADLGVTSLRHGQRGTAGRDPRSDWTQRFS